MFFGSGFWNFPSPLGLNNLLVNSFCSAHFCPVTPLLCLFVLPCVGWSWERSISLISADNSLGSVGVPSYVFLGVSIELHRFFTSCFPEFASAPYAGG